MQGRQMHAFILEGRETWAPARVAARWRLLRVTSQGCRWAGGTSMGNRLHDAWAGWGRSDTRKKDPQKSPGSVVCKTQDTVPGSSPDLLNQNVQG